jgi:hypothetical protein
MGNFSNVCSYDDSNWGWQSPDPSLKEELALVAERQLELILGDFYSVKSEYVDSHWRHYGADNNRFVDVKRNYLNGCYGDIEAILEVKKDAVLGEVLDGYYILYNNSDNSLSEAYYIKGDNEQELRPDWAGLCRF